MKWLLMVDIDEYVWSKRDVHIPNILQSCSGLGQIQIREALFGSNCHISHPATIVPHFTKRKGEYQNGYKYFVNSEYDFSSLNVHHANFTKEEQMKDESIFIRILPEWFLLNHYKCQSVEFWNTVKCTRGDSDNYMTRTPDMFYEFDINEVEDTELLEQNRGIYSIA
jgi:hypothetical protein